MVTTLPTYLSDEAPSPPPSGAAPTNATRDASHAVARRIHVHLDTPGYGADAFSCTLSFTLPARRAPIRRGSSPLDKRAPAPDSFFPMLDAPRSERHSGQRTQVSGMATQPRPAPGFTAALIDKSFACSALCARNRAEARLQITAVVCHQARRIEVEAVIAAVKLTSRTETYMTRFPHVYRFISPGPNRHHPAPPTPPA